MRILLITEGDAERYDSWSGSAKSVVDHLRRSGHEVITADADLYGCERLVAAGLVTSMNRKRWGVRYHLGAPGFALRSRKAALSVRQLGGGCDIILQIGATFRLPDDTRIPYVLFCDSNIETSKAGAAYGVSDAGWLTASELAAVRAREARVYGGARAILTISDFLRRSFIRDFGIHEERVISVGAGPNLDASRLPPPRNGPRTGPPTILFVGKQFQRKGGDYLLAAFRRVRDIIGDARLTLIGPVDCPSRDPGIDWLGNVDKNTPEGWLRIRTAFEESDVLCLPSLFEPFGIAVLEAMYFGLPCVGTNQWAIPEMIVDGVTGFTTPLADAEALADRLIRVLNDRETAFKMGSAGRSRALEQFSWDGVAARMGRVFESIVFAGHQRNVDR